MSQRKQRGISEGCCRAGGGGTAELGGRRGNWQCWMGTPGLGDGGGCKAVGGAGGAG